MLFDESLFSAKCYLFGRKIHLFCPFLPENFYTSFEAAFLQNRRYMSLQRVKKRLRHFLSCGFCRPWGSRAAKPAKNENLTVFIRLLRACHQSRN